MKKELKIALYIALGIFGTHILFILQFAAVILLLVALVVLVPNPGEPMITPFSSLGDRTGGTLYTFYLFQDGAQYQKSYYENPNFEGNPYFQPVTQENKREVIRFLDHFELLWIEGMEDAPTEQGRVFYQGYDYDRTTLDETDYYYINKRLSTEDYDLYIFDVQQNTLYFFHSFT